MLSSNERSEGAQKVVIESWKWSVLALAAAALFIVVLDFSVVNVAMPSIGKDLKFTPTSLQWIASAYALTFGGFLLLGGRCSDLLGRRDVLLTGVGIFTFASLVAGCSGWVPGFARELLIVCRAVQGLGGALIGPAALAVVNTTFAEGPERNRALGVFGSVATAGFACGNLVGGVLTGHCGWPSIFFVNVPLGLLLMVLPPRLVPRSAEKIKLDWSNLDIGGAVTVTSSLVLLVYGFVGAEQNGWGSLYTIGAFVSSAIFLIAFLVIEKTVKSPLVPLAIFKKRSLTGANIAMLLIEGINAALILLLSLYLQQVQGYSPQATGFAFLPMALWLMIVANIAPTFVSRWGARGVLIGGSALSALAPLMLARLHEHSNYFIEILPVLLLSGTGMAGSVTAGFIIATSGLPDDEQGLASGLIQTAQQIGAALGLAILMAVSATQANAAKLAGATPVAAEVAGLHAAFLMGTLFAVAAALVGAFGIRKIDMQPLAKLELPAETVVPVEELDVEKLDVENAEAGDDLPPIREPVCA